MRGPHSSSHPLSVLRLPPVLRHRPQRLGEVDDRLEKRLSEGPVTNQRLLEGMVERLSLLHNRQKWRRQGKDLRVNELVLIVNEQLPRSVWKMARVVQADAEVDEHVRKALVRLADGKVVLRDRTSLVSLELDGETDSDGSTREMDS